MTSAPSRDPLVRVVIPTYNRARLLKRAIASIRNQTLQDWRLLILNNASPDDTEDVIAQAKREDSRIDSITHPINIGGIGNFQAGLTHIDTEFFVLLSDDDLILPEQLERGVDALGREPDAISYISGCIHVADDQFVEHHSTADWETRCYARGEIVARMVKQGIFNWTSIVYRRAAAPIIQTYMTVASGDSVAQLRMAQDHAIYIDSRPGGVFFKHGSGWSQNYSYVEAMSSHLYVLSAALSSPTLTNEERFDRFQRWCGTMRNLLHMPVRPEDRAKKEALERDMLGRSTMRFKNLKLAFKQLFRSEAGAQRRDRLRRQKRSDALLATYPELSDVLRYVRTLTSAAGVDAERA